MITWAERAKAVISQTGQGGTAKTDETHVSRLLAVSSVPGVAISSMPERLSTVLAVPSPVILEKHDSSLAVTEDPDGWCWPHSTAMTGAEIDNFKARLSKFGDKGLTAPDGEALADKLVLRDREADDRRVCPECRNLSGYSPGSWRCSNWKPASVGTSGLPLDLVLMLQRCNGFENLNILGLLQSEHDPKFARINIF